LKEKGRLVCGYTAARLLIEIEEIEGSIRVAEAYEKKGEKDKAKEQIEWIKDSRLPVVEALLKVLPITRPGVSEFKIESARREVEDLKSSLDEKAYGVALADLNTAREYILSSFKRRD
jgi:hypothetical protein